MDIDYSKLFPAQKHGANHALFLLKNIFCIIAGATGCGKTNLMLNFLLNEKVLDYGDAYIYTSTLHQPAYTFLKKYYNDLENTIKSLCRINAKIGHFYDVDDDEIKNPSELDTKTNHVMVFDDVMLDDQTRIKDYFCRGRHNNVNVFYLCQSLHKISKH